MKEFIHQGLHCVLEGKGDTLFVLFHGLFGSKENKIIRILREHLSKKSKVLSFDMTGHGKSHGDLASFTLTRALHDADTIMHHSKDICERRIIIGYSFGAYPALHSAALHNITGIALINPVSEIIPLAFTRNGQHDVKEYAQGTTLFSRAMFLLDALKHDQYKTARKIRCPAFIFHSISDERVDPRQSIKLSRQLDDIELLLASGDSHEATRFTEHLPCLDNWIRKLP